MDAPFPATSAPAPADRRHQGTLSLDARGHQFGNAAVFGDRHPDHRPLRHGRVVFVPLEGAGILPDL